MIILFDLPLVFTDFLRIAFIPIFFLLLLYILYQRERRLIRIKKEIEEYQKANFSSPDALELVKCNPVSIFQLLLIPLLCGFAYEMGGGWKLSLQLILLAVIIALPIVYVRYTKVYLQDDHFTLQTLFKTVAQFPVTDIQSARFVCRGGTRTDYFPDFTPCIYFTLSNDQSPDRPVPMSIKNYILLKRYLDHHRIPYEDEYPQGLHCLFSRIRSQFKS